MAYICLKYSELYYNIVTVCLYLPRIWGRREEIWEMSLVPPNFEELSNPSGSHTSHRAKSWSYQYSITYSLPQVRGSETQPSIGPDTYVMSQLNAFNTVN